MNETQAFAAVMAAAPCGPMCINSYCVCEVEMRQARAVAYAIARTANVRMIGGPIAFRVVRASVRLRHNRLYGIA